jgi:glycosyltransferase involved in cell wall biosynthesis
MIKKKTKLLIFSQCYIYGGSERLMQSIYKNKYILNDYDITFSYSYFKDYKSGLEQDSMNQIFQTKFQPLYLLTNGDIYNKINLRYGNKILRRIFKMPLHFVELTGLYALWNSFYLFIFLLYSKPNVVHINNGGYPAAPACNEFSFILFFFPSIRVIYQVNNKAVRKKGFWGVIKDWFIGMSVDIFLTHSIQNRKALIYRGFKENKVKTIPSYFNETILESKLSIDQITKRNFTLCMVGFLSHRKGQLFLLKALLEIRKRNHPLIDNLQVNIVGDGEERFKLIKYIEENNLQKIVTLWGSRSDYYIFIKECHLYMMTSVEGEDMPLVLLTAMQCRRCIIASDFAGISDLLTHNYDAFLISPNLNSIVCEIADAIIYLYEHPNVRKSLAENVEHTFNEKLGEKKYAENLMELYKKNIKIEKKS